MKKIIFVLLCVLVILKLYDIYADNVAPAIFNRNEVTPTISQTSVQIGTIRYRVELADNDAERQQGLSGRSELAPSTGMLFIFPSKDTYAFWMKDMKFPLDLIWVDGDTISDITENVPIPLTQTYLPQYRPKLPIDKVLEINVGEVKKHGFFIGQKVNITIILEEDSEAGDN